MPSEADIEREIRRMENAALFKIPVDLHCAIRAKAICPLSALIIFTGQGRYALENWIKKQ